MESAARKKILELLKMEGPSQASDMAKTLGVSAMAVRQHLYALSDEGLVVAEERALGVGRPRKIWSLTGAADAFFPHGYADLTADLLTVMRRTFGEEGLNKLIRERLADQIKSYRARLDALPDLKKKVEALAAIRCEEGYMASATSQDGVHLLVENHCPICAAAKACTGLCASELELFQTVLGDGVDVTRTDHILAGARRCAYRIKATASSA